MTSLTSRGQLLLSTAFMFATASLFADVPAFALVALPVLVLLANAWVVTARVGRLAELGLIAVQVESPTASSVRGSRAHVSLSVANVGAIDSGAFTARLVLPRGLASPAAALLRFDNLPAAHDVSADVELVCSRTGMHAISAVRLDFVDAFMFSRTVVHLAVDVVVTVVPAAIDDVGTRRARFAGRDFTPGRHRRDRPGAGLDLRELREYRSGDLVRHIAWKPSLRSGGLLVRQHEDESSTQAMILLDAGPGMRGVDGAMLEHALGAVMSIAYGMHADGDAVGVLSFDDGVIGGIAPARSPLQAERVARHLATLPHVAPEESSEVADDALIAPIVEWLQLVDRVDLKGAVRRNGPDEAKALLERYLLERHGGRIERWTRAAAAAGFDVSGDSVLRRAAVAAGLEVGWRAEVRFGARETALANVLRRVATEYPRVRSCFVFTDLGGMIALAGLRAALTPAIAAGLDLTFAVAWAPEFVTPDEDDLDARALHESLGIAERRQKQRRIDELRSAGARVVTWGAENVEVIAERVLRASAV